MVLSMQVCESFLAGVASTLDHTKSLFDLTRSVLKEVGPSSKFALHFHESACAFFIDRYTHKDDDDDDNDGGKADRVLECYRLFANLIAKNDGEAVIAAVGNSIPKVFVEIIEHRSVKGTKRTHAGSQK